MCKKYHHVLGYLSHNISASSSICMSSGISLMAWVNDDQKCLWKGNLLFPLQIQLSKSHLIFQCLRMDCFSAIVGNSEAVDKWVISLSFCDWKGTEPLYRLCSSVNKWNMPLFPPPQAPYIQALHTGTPTPHKYNFPISCSCKGTNCKFKSIKPREFH
jgi:hypothetical protein